MFQLFSWSLKILYEWGVNMDKAEVEGKKRGTGRMSEIQMDVEERRLDQDRGTGWRRMECVDGKGE